jgi:predicted ribosome quality control (RQC) complex YloA/Tae2 family protein
MWKIKYDYSRLSRIYFYDDQIYPSNEIEIKKNVSKIAKMREENYQRVQRLNVTIKRLGSENENDRCRTLH